MSANRKILYLFHLYIILFSKVVNSFDFFFFNLVQADFNYRFYERICIPFLFILFIYFIFADQPKDGSYDDGKLIVVTDSQVIAIKLHRCNSEKITSCSECVALQDPYCGWDKIAGKCRSHGAPKWLEENYFYQNVSTGQHAACPSGKMSSKDANAGEQKGE